MGIFRQVMLALWHQLYLRPLVRRRLESLVESLMPPLFCLALVLAGPPFCDTRAELPFSRGIAVHWPCELAEAQVRLLCTLPRPARARKSPRARMDYRNIT